MPARLEQYPDAISMLTRGRLLAGDHRVKIAASDEVSLREAFVARGARGFWQEMQSQGAKDALKSGSLACRNCLPAWEIRKTHWRN